MGPFGFAVTRGPYILVATAGGLAVVVGAHDAVLAWWTSRMLGIILVAAGLIALSGLRLVTGWKRSSVFVRWASPAAGVCIALAVLITQGQTIWQFRESIGRDWQALSVVRVPSRFWLVLFFFVAVAGAGILLLLQYLRHPDRRAHRWPILFGRPWLLKQLSVPLILGVVVSAVQFYNTVDRMPFEAPATVRIGTDLTRLGTRTDQVAISVTITLRNISGAEIVVIGSQYRLTGNSAVVRSKESDLGNELRQAELGGPGVNTSSQRESTLVRLGRIVPAAHRLAADEEFTTTFVEMVPSRFDRIQLQTHVFAAKGNLLQFDQSPDPGSGQLDPCRNAYPGAVYGCTQLSVSEASWIRRWTGPRYEVIETWRLPVAGTLPDVSGDPSVKLVAELSGSYQVAPWASDFYRISEFSNERELSLWDAAEKK